MNIKKMHYKIGAIIGIIILLMSFFYILNKLIFSSVFLAPDVKYGEFPFKLVYEVDGNKKVIEDTIICEFDGYELKDVSGINKKWKVYLKSGNQQLTLLDLRQQDEFNEFGQKILELYFYYGNAEYYMNDGYEFMKQSSQDLNKIAYDYSNSDGTTGGSSYDANTAYEKFKIKLISWEVAPPIKTHSNNQTTNNN